MADCNAPFRRTGKGVLCERPVGHDGPHQHGDMARGLHTWSFTYSSASADDSLGAAEGDQQ